MKTISFEERQSTKKKKCLPGTTAYLRRRVFSSCLLTFFTLAFFWFIARIL